MLKKSLIPIMFLSFLLSSCSSWFGNKTIEYDEEVKLSDGSMIWVHIKRHYTYVSAIGQGSGYKATRVEISWDTGFQGIGRQTLEFDGEHGLDFLDKVNGVWYVHGGKTRCSPPAGGVYNDKGKCWEGEGNRGAHSSYLYVIAPTGFVKNRSLNALDSQHLYNILDIRGLDEFKDSDDSPITPDDKSISWQEKLEIQNNRHNFGDIFGLPVNNT